MVTIEEMKQSVDSIKYCPKCQCNCFTTSQDRMQWAFFVDWFKDEEYTIMRGAILSDPNGGMSSKWKEIDATTVRVCTVSLLKIVTM